MNFAAIAEAGSHVDELAALYDGSLQLDGLEIDTDLGWELLIALVAAGRAGDAEIDERLAGDNTATGQQSAAHARAAIPTPRARSAPGRRSSTSTRRRTPIVRETAEGFLVRATPPCSSRSWSGTSRCSSAIWDDRSYAIAEKLVDGLYPSPLANRALADASRAWLERTPTCPRCAASWSSGSRASTAPSPRRSATRRGSRDRQGHTYSEGTHPCQLPTSRAAKRSSVLLRSCAPVYEVDLDLTRGGETFRSETVVRFRAAPGASTFIEACTATLHSVVLNGETLDPAAVSDGTRIRLDELAAENELRVVADARYTNTGEGLHRFVDPVDDAVYLYTEFAVAEANRVFAVFDQPDLKASVALHDHRAGRLEGAEQRADAPTRCPPRPRARRRGPSRPAPSSRATSSPSSPGPTRRGTARRAASTAATSRSACSPAPRSPSMRSPR